jgi:CBS domain-containing protein
MTAPAITVTGDLTITEAARRMIRHGVKRLPVVDRYGKLVGIVSRADLIRAFARGDEELLAEVREEVLERALCLAPGTVRADVSDGVVTLTGELDRKSLVPIAVSLTRQVPGVVDVVDRLTFTFDDTHAKTVPGDLEPRRS